MTTGPSDDAVESARRVVTTRDGATLSVHVRTPPGADASTPTVVIGHGWTLTHRTWSPVVDALGELPVRVVAWDQRGHGESGLGLGRRAVDTLSISHLGRDLAAVIDDVVPAGSPLVLAGHSLGGMTVLSYAGQFPEVVRDRVGGVLLVSTASHGLTTGSRRLEAAAMAALAKGLPLRAGRLVTQGAQRRVAFGEGASEQDVAHARAQVAATRLTTVGAFYGALSRLDESRSLEALAGVPVRILVGSRDRLTPPSLSRRIHDGIPGSDLTVLEGRGHMLTYEAAPEVADALRSLLAPLLPVSPGGPERGGRPAAAPDQQDAAGG